MGKRVVTRPGDIFRIPFDDGTMRYFQFMIKDSSNLNGEVIRVFHRVYDVSSEPTMDEIINDKIAFITHTFLRSGLNFGAWEKVGHHNDTGIELLKEIYFGCTQDVTIGKYFHVIEQNPLRNWDIWRVNEPRQRIGRLPESMFNVTEIGTVKSYLDVCERAKRGYFIYTNDENSILKRKPFSDYKSYIKKVNGDTVTYFQFVGETATKELVIKKNGKKIKMTTEQPKGGLLRRLRTAKFGETNWEYDDFITREEFDAAWNAD